MDQRHENGLLIRVFTCQILVFLFSCGEVFHLMIYKFDLASFRDVNSGVVHIKTLWMSCCRVKAHLLSLSRRSSKSCLPFTCSPHLLPPTLSLCFHAYTLNPPTHTQFYLLWHLAPDRCSSCSLYLQPLKWVIFSGLWFRAELCLQSHLWLPEFTACWRLKESEALVSR